jgi:hypothetical protein
VGDGDRYLVVRVGEATQFKASAGGGKDDRVGKWMADVYLVWVTEKGETLEYPGSKLAEMPGWVDFSGLWDTYWQAHGSALQSARAAVRALRLVGKRVWLWDCSKRIEQWSDSDMDIGAYLAEQEHEAERRAQRASLREQAKALLAEARAI